ncbi:phage scaffolding protein [Cytobacillus massiliigabonensis]|uniref:phage scaffolding protein n=1 Tax=Cytobacillus massiliigabonensis TaxID=1871011 RepID=UPI000C820DBF|nr:phage scaffolding protein [Cytobacillus massiliigabonensis]
MNKEQLIALGLTAEQADKVISGFGQMVPKSRLDDKINEVKDLNDQISQRDRDLKDLKDKAAGNEDLQTKLANLQKQYDDDKSSFETKLKDTQLSSALKLALAGKVHDADLVTGLIDKTKIELSEDGNVSKGLDEQIKELQTSKSFLFVPEKPNKPTLRGFVPSGGNNDDDKSTDIGANFAKMANEKASSNKSDNSPWG